MDCFYAAIECRDDPSVADQPVGVGGTDGRGVLTTCNYIARQYGCRSAMPVFMAREKCPHLILKPIRFEVYRTEARRIRTLMREVTALVEPLSLDEAFLDVTDCPGYAWDLAKALRKRIFSETGLTASAGVAPNKMLAKIASDWRKPNGQFAIIPEQIEAFMRDLPVRKLWGIGPKSAEALREKGITTCGQLQEWPVNTLIHHFGRKWGLAVYELCRGRDDRPVEVHRPRKSLSTERTFAQNLETLEACQAVLPQLLQELEDDLINRLGSPPFHKIFLKLKFADFRTTTKEGPARTLAREQFEPLLEEAFGRSARSIRLLGVGVRFPEPAPSVPAQMVFPFYQ